METLVPAFLLALLAQPGDRPALLTAILADRFGEPLRVALAAGAAHAIGNALAAFAGGALASMLVPEARSLLLAVALIVGAGSALAGAPLPGRRAHWRLGAFGTPFAGVLALALGAQTQFFTFALAAGGMPWLAAAGATLGASAVALVAAQLGEAGWTRLPLRRLRQAAAAIFLVAGIVIGLGALRLTH